MSLTGTSIGVRSVSYLNREFLLAFSVVLQANSDSSLVFKYLHFSRHEVDLERCTCTEILYLRVNYHDFDDDHPTYIGTYILYVRTGMYCCMLQLYRHFTSLHVHIYVAALIMTIVHQCTCVCIAHLCMLQYLLKP